jgi:integrase
MRPIKAGVEVRPTSLRIVFQYRGKRCRKTLCIAGRPLPPTPANVKYAYRVAAEIGDKIQADKFAYKDYFPGGPAAISCDEDVAVPLLFDVFDRWLRVADLKSSTRSQYRTRINSFWTSHLKNVPVDRVRHLTFSRPSAPAPGGARRAATMN